MQNIGLMAQKAEEYGSHPTTFELAEKFAPVAQELKNHETKIIDAI